jgi:hypothetical protein
MISNLPVKMRLVDMACSIIYHNVKELLKKCLFPVSLRGKGFGFAVPEILCETPSTVSGKTNLLSTLTCFLKNGTVSYNSCDGLRETRGRMSILPRKSLNGASMEPRKSLDGASNLDRNRGSILGASRLQRGKIGSAQSIISG